MPHLKEHSHLRLGVESSGRQNCRGPPGCQARLGLSVFLYSLKYLVSLIHISTDLCSSFPSPAS